MKVFNTLFSFHLSALSNPRFLSSFSFVFALSSLFLFFSPFICIDLNLFLSVSLFHLLFLPSPYTCPSLPIIFSLSCPLHLSLAAVAGGGTTARRGTATDGTNTRRARGARRAKRPARRSAQTKRIRKPWSSDDHFPSFIPSFVSMLTRKGENERETKKTRKWLSDRWTCHSPLHQSPFSSTLLSFTLTITSE